MSVLGRNLGNDLIIDLEMYQVLVDGLETSSKNVAVTEEQSKVLAKTKKNIDGLKKLIIDNVVLLQMHGYPFASAISQTYKIRFESSPQKLSQQYQIAKIEKAIADIKDILND